MPFMHGRETGNGKRATGTLPPLTGNGERGAGNGQVGELRIGSDIADRLLELGAAVVRIVKTLPKDTAGKHIGQQLLRAATSGGANYEEARAAESPSDFVHKVFVANKELRESIFWLKLIRRSELTPVSVVPILSEANQLTAILSASARTARKRIKDGTP